ncbi:hypothetical protein E2C01_064218 [Portunus trituberculatus]|uniref:Uncharacterized protein n=1 Tax=Portunus trituberculatus TaxID=210409 RepID=A0A5B7HK84_PORTR|nr:hypothetical protein [Portunus trituberculatus]
MVMLTIPMLSAFVDNESAVKSSWRGHRKVEKELKRLGVSEVTNKQEEYFIWTATASVPQ